MEKTCILRENQSIQRNPIRRKSEYAKKRVVPREKRSTQRQHSIQRKLGRKLVYLERVSRDIQTIQKKQSIWRKLGYIPRKLDYKEKTGVPREKSSTRRKYPKYTVYSTEKTGIFYESWCTCRKPGYPEKTGRPRENQNNWEKPG